MGGDGGDLAGVVRLDAPDRDERVAALCESLRGEVLELPRLVAAVGEAGIAVLPLGPDLDPPAELRGEAVKAVDRGGAEEQRDSVVRVQAHWLRSVDQRSARRFGPVPDAWPGRRIEQGARGAAFLVAADVDDVVAIRPRDQVVLLGPSECRAAEMAVDLAHVLGWNGRVATSGTAGLRRFPNSGPGDRISGGNWRVVAVDGHPPGCGVQGD